MTGQALEFAADVKCYFCGHVSGQIVGRRRQPLRATDFVPRPGYKGPEVGPRTRLRCERCNGPVFFEDASPVLGRRFVSDMPDRSRDPGSTAA